eukprot:ANDGO_07695.mRNA.1 DENN domain and WD repeat-containing protein SCD1
MVLKRLVDYAVLCGPGPVLIPSTQVDLGCALEKCIFQPVQTDRYPKTDFKESPLPDTVPMFCFPLGISLRTGPRSRRSHMFVLTSADGTKLYASSVVVDVCLAVDQAFANVVFQHDDDIKQLVVVGCAAEDQRSGGTGGGAGAGGVAAVQQIKVRGKSNKVWAQRCLCLISHYDFSAQFGKVLELIAARFVTAGHLFGASQLGATEKNVNAMLMQLKLEEILRHLMRELPLPPYGKIIVESQLFDSVAFSLPAPNYLDDCRMDSLTSHLDLNSMLCIFQCILLEQKIVLCHPDSRVLCQMSQGFVDCIFPLHWCHVFIPCLPLSLTDFLHAPVPFIIGMPIEIAASSVAPNKICAASGMDLGEFSDSCVLVDCCHSKVFMSAEIERSLSPLPHQKEKLRQALKNSAGSRDVRSAFFRFWVSLLLDYRSCLISNPNAVSASASHLDFISKSKTTSFSGTDASNHRTSFVGGGGGGGAAATRSDLDKNSRDAIVHERRRTMVSFPDVQKVQDQDFDSFVNEQSLQDEVEIIDESNSGVNSEEMYHFDHARFLKESPVSDRPFLISFFDTQAFHFFIQQRTTANNDLSTLHEIALFDESIVQKRNRSKLKTVKEPTPFLDDVSYLRREKKMYPYLSSMLVGKDSKESRENLADSWSTQESPLVTPGSLMSSPMTTPNSSRPPSPTNDSSSVPASGGASGSFPPLKFSTESFGRVQYVKPLVGSEEDDESTQLNKLIAQAHRNPLLENLVSNAMISKQQRGLLSLPSIPSATFIHAPSTPSVAVDTPSALPNSITFAGGQRKRVYTSKQVKEAKKIQLAFLTFLARRRFLKIKVIAANLQSRVKCHRARKSFLHFRASAITIQSWWRMVLFRRAFLDKKQSALLLQRVFRGTSCRHRVARDCIQPCLHALLRVFCSLPLPAVSAAKFAREAGASLRIWSTMNLRFPALQGALLDVASQNKMVHSLVKQFSSTPAVDAAAAKKSMHQLRQKEKRALYPLLKKHATRQVLDSLFKEFGIDVNGKRRKRLLIKFLFTLRSDDLAKSLFYVQQSEKVVAWILALPNSLPQWTDCL